MDRRLVAYDDNGKRSLTTQPTFALTRNMKIRCPMSWLMVARQTRSRWGNEIKQMIHKNGGNMYKPFTFNGFRYKIIDSPFKHEKSVIKEGILKRVSKNKIKLLLKRKKTNIFFCKFQIYT